VRIARTFNLIGPPRLATAEHELADKLRELKANPGPTVEVHD
jgi:hypothetical protein